MRQLRAFLIVSSFLFVALFANSRTHLFGQQPFKSDASSVEEATRVIDLSSFPTFNLKGEPNGRTVAMQSYVAEGSVKQIFGRISEHLKEANFTELSPATVSDAYATGIFGRSGFAVSVTIMPGGEQGTVVVNLQNHGNVQLDKIKLPGEWKTIYASPISSILQSTLQPKEASDSLLGLLSDGGWRRLGSTTATQFFVNNAVRLQVMVSPAPSGDGSMVQLSSELISVDLPSLPANTNLQYSETTKTLLFDTSLSLEDSVEHLRQSLAMLKWKPTTEGPIKSGFEFFMIFRKAEGGMFEATFRQLDSGTRVKLRYQTPKEFAETESRAKAKAVEMNTAGTQESSAKQSIVIPSPKNTKLVKQKDSVAEFETTSGSAAKSVSSWLDQLQQKDWKVMEKVRSKEAGNFEATLGDSSMTITYIDPGFIPGTITIQASNGKHLSFKD